MHVLLRVLVAAAVFAIPAVTATSSSAYPCVTWQGHLIYRGQFGELWVPAPTDIRLDGC